MVVGGPKFFDVPAAAAMVMEDRRPRIEADKGSGPCRGGDGVDVFAREPRSGPEPWIEATDPIEDVTAERQVCALNLASVDELEWLNLMRRVTLVDCNLGIEGVEQHDPAAHAADPRMGVEDINDRIDVIIPDLVN